MTVCVSEAVGEGTVTDAADESEGVGGGVMVFELDAVTVDDVGMLEGDDEVVCVHAREKDAERAGADCVEVESRGCVTVVTVGVMVVLLVTVMVINRRLRVRSDSVAVSEVDFTMVVENEIDSVGRPHPPRPPPSERIVCEAR